MTLADCKAWALKEKGPITLVIVQEGIYADDFAEYDADGHSYGYCTPEALDIVYLINPKWPADFAHGVKYLETIHIPAHTMKIKMLKDPASGKFLTQSAYDRWAAGRDIAELPIHAQWTDDEAKAATFASDDAPPTEGFVLVDAISPREK